MTMTSNNNDPLEMPDYLRDAVRNILDTFSGADGGASFVTFRGFLEEMAKREKNNDIAAKQIIDIVLQFSKMIDIANMK